MAIRRRMRQKAKDKGALESNEQQSVETKVVEEKQDATASEREAVAKSDEKKASK
jgi:hypothetical protein